MFGSDVLCSSQDEDASRKESGRCNCCPTPFAVQHSSKRGDLLIAVTCTPRRFEVEEGAFASCSENQLDEVLYRPRCWLFVFYTGCLDCGDARVLEAKLDLYENENNLPTTPLMHSFEIECKG